jgi:hypothetical protein
VPVLTHRSSRRHTLRGMQKIGQPGLLAFLSLALLACNAKGPSPRDGGASSGAGGGGGVVATGGTSSGGSGGSGGIAMASDGPTAFDVGASDLLAGEGGVAACGVVGDACTGQTGCSSGDDVEFACRSILVCQNGGLRPASLQFVRCGATSGNACPATQPTDGATCILTAQTCSYPTGTCTCATGCEGGTDAGPCQRPKTWHCDRPPSAGCPSQAPHLGAPCATERAFCTYGCCCAQYRVTCQSGYWEPQGYMSFGGCA